MERLKSSYLESNIIFCIWSGINLMSTNRIQALYSILANTGCPIAFVNHGNLKQWEKFDFPFHPAFYFLSETHKSDYLRVYLMHHYGGGYTDIKHTHKNWASFFKIFNDSDKICAGYTELSPNTVAQIGGDDQLTLENNFNKLIGLCSFIFRPYSAFTELWMNKTHDILDRNFDALCKFPSSYPQDQFGLILPNGTSSKYPLSWTELLGNIFHPLIYDFKEQVMHLPISPDFTNYR